jgi:predicted RNA methylase
MGKHETGYARADKDFYPTRQPWITQALLKHVAIGGLTVLESAAGEGDMAEVLKAAGPARVYTNDIMDRGYPLNWIEDFTTAPIFGKFDAVITNPPQGGRSCRLYGRFIETGLSYDRLS